MAEAQLIQTLGRDGSSLLQPPNNLLLVVQLVLLAAHDTQHNNLVLGQVAQGAEVTTARIVVLEEVRIDVEFLEENLSNRLVAAGREPLGAVVAAAQVDADLHVCGALGDGGVDESSVLAGQNGEVLATLVLGGCAHVRVAEVGEVCVVELDEAAAGLVERVEFLLVHAGEVLEEDVEVRVCRNVDAGAAAAEVDHCGGGNADFGCGCAAILLDGLLEEVEVVDLDGVRVAQFAGDDEGWRREAVLVADVANLALLLDAREVLQEVEMEVCAAELAICDAAEPVLDLQLCDFGDGFVFDLAQVGGGDVTIRSLAARIEDLLGSQEGADVVSAVDAVRERHCAGGC